MDNRACFWKPFDSERVKDNENRLEKDNEKNDKRKKTWRRPLNIGEKVLNLAEPLTKKEAQENYIKAQPKINLFLIEIRFLLLITVLD